MYKGKCMPVGPGPGTRRRSHPLTSAGPWDNSPGGLLHCLPRSLLGKMPEGLSCVFSQYILNIKKNQHLSSLPF